MTYPVPGYPLFVDGAFYTAEQWRQFDGGVAVQDAGTASAVSPAGGVYGNPAVSMLVTAAAGMAVTVNAGYCSVPNSSGSGAYRFGLMQQAGLTVPANTTGDTRLDYVIAGVSDVGAGSSSFVEYLTGTTSVPSLPANSIVLAQVSVANGATGISSGQITDLRTFVAPPGCIVPVTSAGAAPIGPSGQLYYDTATSQLLYSPVTVVTEELTGSGNWTSPLTGTIAARATGGGAGGTGLNSGSPGSQTYYFSETFTPEEGVTAVTIQLWGDGGGGGWHTEDHLGGGGGGGGYILATGVPVSYPNSYTVSVGFGGAGGTESTGSSSGQGTTFTGDGGVSVTAAGGTNGTGTTAGQGGSSTSSGTTGTVSSYTGGDGSSSGGGGGGAGSQGDGGGGSAGGGGFGGSPDGGGGGDPFSSGQQPGGGGGGAQGRAGENNAGNGGSGMAVISWSPDSQGGGGGGGGEMAYEPALAVVEGTQYPYSVGTGGGDSVNGTNTTLQGQSVTLLAGGGQATSATATGGAGGNLSGNTVHYPGGMGGTGAASGGEFGYGGGGGASGSSTGAGQAGGTASATAPGTGGSAGPYGGAGGAGGNQAAGSAGAVPGGGGGGSPGEGLGFAAGSGGDGTLTLNYTIAPGGIPFQLANPQTWYAWEPSGSLSSVSLSMTADGTSDYEIAVWASNTGPKTSSTHGQLQILANGSQLDAVSAQSSTGVTSAGHWNAGWVYYTSGAQGTTLAPGDYTIEFTSSFGTLEGPAYVRVTQVLP